MHLSMDGGKSYHPPHTHQQPASTLYGIPAFQSQIGMPSIENSALPASWWNSVPYLSAPYSAPSYLSDSQ
uniref:Uncharacterized protein n=2 Tax=Sphaerodactylus townsendi TaxID=933632 RepID=A0ACB8F2D1_9SAUR